MRKNITIIAVILLMVITSLPVFALHEKSDENVCIENIISEFNYQAENSTSLEELILIGNTLFNFRDRISIDRAVSIVKNNFYNEKLRATMADILLLNPDFEGLDATSVEKVLFDDNIGYQLKHNIIWLLSDTTLNKQLLQSLVINMDELIAFQSLMKLEKLDDNMAIKIADDILLNYKNEDVKKVQAAIRVKAMCLSRYEGANFSDVVKEYVDFCKELYDFYADKILKDSITFALSDLRDEYALYTLINREDVAKESKAYCINENKEVLLNMAEEAGYNEEKVVSIINALEIYPLKEVKLKLITKIGQQRYIELKQQASFIGVDNSPRATGFQGYAVFRKGIFSGLAGHAGLMVGASSYAAQAVVEANLNGVEIVNWDTFMANLAASNFWGVYEPNSGISNSGRDLVVGTAYNLNTFHPGYTAAAPIAYPASLFGKAKLYPSDIVNIRCDGVVEYSYEYNSYKIFGNLHWNISIPSQNSIADHTLETPLAQLNKMTLVQSARPY